MRDWLILDAHEVDIAAIEEFAAANGPQVALMAEYLESLQFNPTLREYVLCVVAAATGKIAGVCWIGGNIVPVKIPAASAKDLVWEIHRRESRYSSIVGPKADVEAVWEHAKGLFGVPREIRAVQPHLEISTPPMIAPDRHVVATALADFDLLLPAAVEMFIEEVGYSPLSAGGGYERRVRWLVAQRRSLSRMLDTVEGRQVLFKADLGTVGFGVTQIQGVWVHPEYRGRGLAAPAVAAVVNYAQQNVAPTVSLYVNDYNTPARATYQSVGFTQTDTFATILF